MKKYLHTLKDNGLGGKVYELRTVKKDKKWWKQYMKQSYVLQLV